MEAGLAKAEEEKTLANARLEAALTNSGISPALYAEFDAFCTSLDPEYGQRGGFSITCNSEHNGNYIGYDPEFALFKESIEGSFSDCNYRCEAVVAKHGMVTHLATDLDVV